MKNSQGSTKSSEIDYSRSFRRMVLAFKEKFPLEGLLLPDLIRRSKVIANKLVGEEGSCMAKKQRLLLKVAKCAIEREIHYRFINMRDKYKRWE